MDLGRSKAIIGRAEAALEPAEADLIDNQNSVIIALTDEQQWLTSCDDDALAAGENLAALGTELIQFGSAIALGGGRFRLSRLLRGRGGSEWACAEHAPGDQFCLLKAGTIQSVALPAWAVGATLSAVARGGTPETITFLGENIRPPAPVKFVAEVIDTGDLVLSWTRRSRLGFAWMDGIDTPLGETREEYRVNLNGTSSSIELNVSTPSVTIGAAELAMLGSGTVAIELRQVGDAAASRPIELSLSFS